MGLKLILMPFCPIHGCAKTQWGFSPIKMRLHGTGLILGFYTPGKKRCQPKVSKPWKNGADGGRCGLSWPYALGGAPLKFGHEPGRWVACEYAVRSEIVEQIVLHFGQRPVRDAFADAGNARFERWYGPGSVEGEDAFEKNWGGSCCGLTPRSTCSIRFWTKSRVIRPMPF